MPDKERYGYHNMLTSRAEEVLNNLNPSNEEIVQYSKSHGVSKVIAKRSLTIQKVKELLVNDSNSEVARLVLLRLLDEKIIS